VVDLKLDPTEKIFLRPGESIHDVILRANRRLTLMERAREVYVAVAPIPVVGPSLAALAAATVIRAGERQFKPRYPKPRGYYSRRRRQREKVRRRFHGLNLQIGAQFLADMKRKLARDAEAHILGRFPENPDHP
jgi:hypothetical protein